MKLQDPKTDADGAGTPEAAPGRDGASSGPHRGLGLSSKLLLLTIGFVMIAEILVFVPSVSNFRKNWLMERLAAAQIAAVAVDAVHSHELTISARDALLHSAQVRAVAFRHEGARRLVLRSDMPATIDGHYDLLKAGATGMIRDALAVYLAPSGRFIRVVGQPGFGPGQFIEIVISEDPLKAAMIRFGLNILALSIIISVITAALVYLAINALLVRPMTRLTENMVRFGQDPEDSSRQIIPGTRRDEIGTAERELAHMQGELSETLHQKSRLAALGLAVSKINHDLRNMLANAQLISDRLGGVQDPTVQRFAPKLIASLDRAINLCTETLKFGRAKEAPPQRTAFALKPLVEEVGDSLGLPGGGGIGWRVDIDDALLVDADHGQLYRIFANLVRNSRQALEQLPGGAAGEVVIAAAREGTVVTAEDIPVRKVELLVDSLVLPQQLRLPVSADGSFSVQGLAPGRFTLRAWGDGIPLQLFAGGKLAAGEDKDLGQLRLEPTGAIELVVRRPDGSAPETMQIKMLVESSKPLFASTENPLLGFTFGEEGKARFGPLPRGRYGLRARTQEGEFTALKHVALRPGQIKRIELELQPAAPREFIFHCPARPKHRGYLVVSVRNEGGEQIDQRLLYYMGNSDKSTRMAFNLPEGSYGIEARIDGQQLAKFEFEHVLETGEPIEIDLR